MSVVCDFSFAHDDLDFSVMPSQGIIAGMGYVSDNPAKNLTAKNLASMFAAGMSAGLFFEDTEDDMLGGATSGHAHGSTAYLSARNIGYDAQSCVIVASNDRNSSPDDFPTILDHMEAFAQHVPVVGYYGDQDSIDRLWAHHPEWFYVQSNSTSYGSGVSPHAHLVQQYNHPLAMGRPIDISLIQRPSLPFMGEDMYTQADRDRDNHMATLIGLDYSADSNMLPAVAEMRGNMQNIVHGMMALGHPLDADAFAKALAPLLPNVTQGELETAVQHAVSRVQITLSLPAAQS